MRLIDGDKLQEFPIRANRCDKEHANEHFINMGVCLKIYSDGNVHSAAWQKRKPEDFCSYGERKDCGDADR